MGLQVLFLEIISLCGARYKRAYQYCENDRQWNQSFHEKWKDLPAQSYRASPVAFLDGFVGQNSNHGLVLFEQAFRDNYVAHDFDNIHAM